ncbi:hypothetical protein AVEN_201317-1 [Araneus ventricosus]|uniref:Uncharacterized protein n=1 Tax=Araneus ventricosus TaxID=182803 RepID=A0A4Y2KHS3_ARAVE|nr:hypothetical protein AVEN_201317-1 [Araneus ventricosus]
MPTPYEKEMQRLRKFLAEVENDEGIDFDNEDNGPENILQEIFSDHENFWKNDTESEEDGDSGNCFLQKRALSGEKQNLGRIFVVKIFCRIYLEQMDQRKQAL